jgi:hypothetical protein
VHAAVAGLLLASPTFACDSPRPDAIPPAASSVPEPARDDATVDAPDVASHRPGDETDASRSNSRPPQEEAAEAAPDRAQATAIPDGALVLRSARDVVVRQTPEPSAPLIGIIARARSFVAWDLADGPGCKGQWARLEHGGYACLAAATPSTQPAAPLPILPAGKLVPFLYVAARDDEQPLPVFRSVQAMLRGEPPLVEYAGNSRLAFQKSRAFGSIGRVFLDDRGRAIARDLVRVLEPSGFEGRDLTAAPPPAEHELGWLLDTVELRDAPRDTARAVGTLRKHTQLAVTPLGGSSIPSGDRGSDDRGRDARGWRLVRGSDAAGREIAGWVPPKHVRVWTPPPALDDVAADETWIDVESTTQLLTLMRGDRPVFATLVSTGKAGDRTPPGVYRIRMKHAWGTMRSLPGADEPYRVEGVPWAQYFHQRYALHGVYWHNGFGRPASHGCVNLSPKDARRVFEATSPIIPAGWRSVHETNEHPGTVIRVRRGDAPTPDRRRELERVTDDDAANAERDPDGAPLP